MGFEIFEESGPKHMTSPIDWNCVDQKRAVMACFVNGTTVQECARHHRKTPDPLWWTSFHLNVVENIKDGSSIFGTIYRCNPPLSNSSSSALDYVITFRGTLLKRKTIVKDLRLDRNIIRNELHKKPRAKAALDAARKVVLEYGIGRRVWLAGHSLGATLAMHVGKSMVIDNKMYLETFLFNPPYTDVPIESIISNEKVKRQVRVLGCYLRAMLATSIKGQRGRSDGWFDKLALWVPNLFVNIKDPISSEYVGYFEKRHIMEDDGMGSVGRLATRNSLRVQFRNLLGQDAEPLHLLPSAILVLNSNNCPNVSFGSHPLNQWWQQKLNLEYKPQFPNEDN